MGEIAELGQRIGEARHGRLRQPGALRNLAIAELAFGWREAAQHFEPAREGGHEFAVTIDGGTRAARRRDVPRLVADFQGQDLTLPVLRAIFHARLSLSVTPPHPRDFCQRAECRFALRNMLGRHGARLGVACYKKRQRSSRKRPWTIQSACVATATLPSSQS